MAMHTRLLVISLAILVGGVGGCALAAGPLAVSLLTDSRPGPAATHGLGKLEAALRAKHVTFEVTASAESAHGSLLVVAGRMTGDGPAAQLLREDSRAFPRGPEALVIRRYPAWHGRPVWLLGGADDRGLMYAELDAADRVGWAWDPSAPFSEVRETTEEPAVSTRAISLYTMNRAYWESRFYDGGYWTRYLDTLAQNRFNSIVVIFGYENGGFLAPCYPYFFDTEGFPQVRMVGITASEQRRNLEALNRLIGLAHDRGIAFTAGIWDHIYRGGVQGGGVPGADEAARQPTANLVWGVTAENLVPYTKAALARLVRLVPALDGIQFRMHDESGLQAGEQAGFWRDVFREMKKTAPSLRLDLRAKGLPDAVIQSASEVGVDFRITTKYWMEQMGLPFHPTHINRQNQFERRHSYADLLRYPQSYKIHWRLWNGGTARILLWGDPEYARRFVETTHLYDGDGFEVNEPLATKMEGQPHDRKPFDLLNPSHRYYDYEFERYWHFFQVFGRIGYNPATPAEVWEREFAQRFGPEAGPCVEQALHRASWVLPRIVASSYPYGGFPMTAGWPEKQHLGDLAAFAKAEGSDVQQFANADEEAQLLIEGGETAKVRPQETSRWFAETSAQIQALTAEAERRIGAHRSREFDSTVVDLKVLSGLALYHARRIPAAVSYRLFERVQDPRTLDDAIRGEREAIAAWRQLVAAAGDFYADDLMMGARSRNLCGHWREELASLEQGLLALEQKRSKLPNRPASGPASRYQAAADPAERPVVNHRPPAAAPAGQPLLITAEVHAPSGVKWVRLRYRNVNQKEEYRSCPLLPSGASGHYQATVTADQVSSAWDFMYFIEAMDNQGHGVIFPDLNRQTPYFVLRTGH